MLDLLAKRPLKPAEIARITAAISRTHSVILRNHAPQTGLEAKFSMEFAMAAAVIARRASLGEYTDAFVRRPEVQELMRRVAILTVSLSHSPLAAVAAGSRDIWAARRRA